MMENALKYTQKYGIMMNEDYKYSGRKGDCMYNNSTVLMTIQGYKLADSKEENLIKDMLYNYGPLAIAINADPLQFYTHGILNLSKDECNPQGLNHGVVFVGYGIEAQQEYWIVRNSWGKNWGEKGYFRVSLSKHDKTNPDGVCGINTYMLTATLK